MKPGQLLAVLVAPELSDELAQKEAMIAQAEADIDQAKAAIEVTEALAQSADANVAESIAGQRKVEAEYQRWKSEADRISVLASTQDCYRKACRRNHTANESCRRCTRGSGCSNSIG